LIALTNKKVAMKKIFLLIALIINASFVCLPQDVTLDNTFGDNGIVVTPNARNIDKLITTSDGSIYAAGYYSPSSLVYKWVIAKYLPDGNLDESFGTDGLVHDINTSYESSFVYGLAIQPDNKILIAGHTSAGFNNGEKSASGYSSYITRIHENGDIDTSFGVNGTMSNIFDPLPSNINAIEFSSDDKIVIGAHSTDQSAVIKLNNDGSIYEEWANDGFVYFNEEDLILWGVEAGNDDSYFCYGLVPNGENAYGELISNVAVYKLLSDGSVDTSFGMNGCTEINIDDGYDNYHSLRRLEILDDNKLLLNRLPNTLIKLLPDGSLDPNFGENGVSQYVFPTYDFVVLESESIIVGGTKEISNDNAGYRVARFHKNGLIDSSFNDIGYFNIDISNDDDYMQSMAIQNDGKVLIAGMSELYGDANFAIARLLIQDNTDVSSMLACNADINIYPNPTSNAINFKISNNTKIFSVVFFDIAGSKIIETADIKEPLDLTQIESGVYLLQIETNQGRIVKRIIKK
jgi:uncharacterized delta-60 repeat protein